MTIQSTKIKTAMSTLFLLAVTVLAPACDVFNPHPCNPQEEICVDPDPTFPTDVRAK